MKKTYSLRELAELGNCSKRTISRLLEKNKVPVKKIVGSGNDLVHVSAKDWEALLEKGFH